MAKTAILFPGQGAQFVGMGRDLAENVPECRALFDRASALLGYDLAAISFDGPLEKLTVSAHAQPAIFVHSMAALHAWKTQNPGATWDYSAGLSSGEWTALHVAGVLSFEDTIRVLEARGRLMQEACLERPGGMLTILGADLATLERICRETGVEMANYNTHEQVVLSGAKDAVDFAEQKAKDMGIRKAIRLQVAGAFHSSLMRSAADRMATFLASLEFNTPTMPVVSNVIARPHSDPAAIREAMVEQIYSPVRWCDSIEWMKSQGVTSYLECGPGKVLNGLVRRIDKGASLHSIQDRSGFQIPVGV